MSITATSQINLGATGSPADVDSSMLIEQMLLDADEARYDLLQQHIKMQVDEIDVRNKRLGELTEVQTQIQSMLGKFKSDASNDSTSNGVPSSEKTAYNNLAAGLKDLASRYNLDIEVNANGEYTKGGLETALTKIKANVDALTNKNSSDLLRVQSLKGKSDQTISERTEIIAGLARLLEKLTGNLVTR